MTRVLGRSIFDKIMTETDISPEVETPQDAVILIMDVRGYSGLSERSEPQDLFNIINPLFKIMCEETGRGGRRGARIPRGRLDIRFQCLSGAEIEPHRNPVGHGPRLATVVHAQRALQGNRASGNPYRGRHQ